MNKALERSASHLQRCLSRHATRRSWSDNSAVNRGFSSHIQFIREAEDDDESGRQFSSVASSDDGVGGGVDNKTQNHTAAVGKVDPKHEHQRIWLPNSMEEPLFWSEDVVTGAHSNPHNLVSLLDRIEKQELEGGRMRAKQSGVLHEDPVVDMRMLTENYTVSSLASGLRDREDVLQHCAQLAAQNDFKALKHYLRIYHPKYVLERRKERRRLDVSKPLNATSLETIRKILMRMPRSVTQAHSQRAGVVIALCHVDGVPSLLLEKRATSLRAHPGGFIASVLSSNVELFLTLYHNHR